MSMTYLGKVHISPIDVTRSLREVSGEIWLKREAKNIMCRECFILVFKFQLTQCLPFFGATE
jgi:hypothetical protein